MNFSSDNHSGVCPEIMAALNAANQGPATPYGDDGASVGVEKTIAALFGTGADVFLLATGTAANALALSVLSPPYGGIYCHPRAHIGADECGAPEFFSGGAKLVRLEDRDGKITAADLAHALKNERGDVHRVKPSCVSLSQTAETGVVYGLDEIRAIGGVAREYGLKVHMDGARFANALAAVGCSAAEMTHLAGIDILSFGASKNGAMAAEAVVIFCPGLAEEFAYRRKRGGHLISKMRFVAAQFEAYLKDGLWLAMARHANDCTQILSRGLAGIGDVELLYPADANMLFARLPNPVIDGLRAEGFQFYDWPGEGRSVIRLVTAFGTDPKDARNFVARVESLSNR